MGLIEKYAPTFFVVVLGGVTAVMIAGGLLYLGDDMDISAAKKIRDGLGG